MPAVCPLEDRAVPATLAVVNQLDSGPGSLRQAILDSNSIAGSDTIVFAKSVRGITLTSGELAITDSVNIVGPGERKLTISGNRASRVFDVTAGSVSISGLTIANGRADVNAATIPGAGGGILNQGNLTLDHVTVRGNEAVGDASTARYYGPYFLVGAALGGGVANLGTLTVTNSQINGNQASGGDGSVGPDFPNVVYPGVALGGGIYNLLGNVTIDDSDLRGNSAEGGSNCQGSFASNGFGGAVYNDASLTITDSLLSYNLALGGSGSVGDLHVGHGVGGAIASGSVAALFGGGSAHLTVNKSEFEFNQARGGDNNTLTLPSAFVSPADTPSNGFGGAICVFQGTGAIDRSEFEHNQARGGANGADQNGSLGVGGGAFIFAFIGPVNGLVEKSSFEHNSAVGGYGANGIDGGDGLGGGLAVGSLGAAFGGAGTLTVKKSEVEHNLAQGGSTVVCSSGADGGDGRGGGFYVDTGSTLFLISSHNDDNRARGGHGRRPGDKGQGIGDDIDNHGTVRDQLPTLVAGTTFLPSTAVMDLTLLPNTPFNPTDSPIVIHEVSGDGYLAPNRDAQVGTTITISSLDGEYFGSNPYLPGDYVFGRVAPLTPADYSGSITDVVLDPLDPGFATGQPSSFKSGNFSFEGSSFGFQFITGPIAGVTLYTDPTVPFSFSAAFDGLPPSNGTTLVNNGADSINVLFNGIPVATTSNRHITIVDQLPFHTAGGDFAPSGVPLFTPAPSLPHDASGTMTLLGTYTGNEGSFELLSIVPDAVTGLPSGTFRGSFVFVGPNGDRAYFSYGADPLNPGTFTTTPTATGLVITFDAIFKPVASLSTGRFAKVTGGSFRMIATSEPVVPDPTNPGFTTPFHYTWTGDGFLEFAQ